MLQAVNMLSENELRQKRSELKWQGRFAEAIPIQEQILAITQKRGRIQDISNDWNMLSHLLQQNGQLLSAEEAARHALDTYHGEANPRLETLATYEMKLATILADQQRFTDAVRYGELALEHFSDFHDPPDDFLRSMADQVTQMARQSRTESD